MATRKNHQSSGLSRALWLQLGKAFKTKPCVPPFASKRKARDVRRFAPFALFSFFGVRILLLGFTSCGVCLGRMSWRPSFLAAFTAASRGLFVYQRDMWLWCYKRFWQTVFFRAEVLLLHVFFAPSFWSKDKRHQSGWHQPKRAHMSQDLPAKKSINPSTSINPSLNKTNHISTSPTASPIWRLTYAVPPRDCLGDTGPVLYKD